MNGDTTRLRREAAEFNKRMAEARKEDGQ